MIQYTSPFSKKVISQSRLLLVTLNFPPEVFPTAAESIQFEYENTDGRYLEINVKDNEFIVFYVDKNEDEEEYQFTSITDAQKK